MMNELLKLLQENDLVLTGELRPDGTLVGAVMERNPSFDEEPAYCSFVVTEEDTDMSIKDLITVFFTPAIIAINRNREMMQDSV